MKYVSKTLAEIFPNLSIASMSACVDADPIPVRIGGKELGIFAARIVGRGKKKGKAHLCLLRAPHKKAKHLYLDLSDSIEVGEE